MLEEKPLQQMVLADWISTGTRLKLYPFFSSCMEFNSKWTNDLNIRPKTLKLLKESIGKYLVLTNIGNAFLKNSRSSGNKSKS
jgi:hypothetical protein